MANALALAGVTAVLKDLLNDGLINQNVADQIQFRVTAQPPDRIARREENENPPLNRLNLYLYRATPNTGWVNERLPSRSSSGTRIANPFLALDLSYLLTAYGADDLDAEMLLGYGMQLLHETPVLPRERIRHSLIPARPDADMLPLPFSQLDADTLADQFEQIRISPWHHDTEEMSRLWSSLNVGLRPSAAYKVTVVLIESRASTRSGPPVKERKLYVPVLRRPRIEQLLSNPTPADPMSEPRAGLVITHAHRLVLQGSDLRGALTRVRLDDRLLQGAALIDPGDRRLSFDLPADLWPGILSVQVEHHLAKDAPAVGEIPIATSNTAAFALAPSFAAAPALLPPGLGGLGPADPVNGTVRLTFAHPVGREQQVELLLDEVSTAPPADREAFAFAFQATRPAPNVDEAAIWDVPIQAVDRAIYLVRVRVGGIASDVGGASGALPADIQALADLEIYSDPVLGLQ
jgi:Pvc16 N-terminal domain